MENNQQQAVEALSDWSKWIIGIDIAAATGCVVVLQGGAQGAAKVFLVLAIGAFLCAVLCAAMLVRILASLVEEVPLGNDNNPKPIHQHEVWRGISIGRVSYVQFLLLVLGVTFLFAWVVLKLAPCNNNGVDASPESVQELPSRRLEAVERVLAHLHKTEANESVQAISLLAISEVGSHRQFAIKAASLAPSEAMRRAVHLIAADVSEADSPLITRTLQSIASSLIEQAGGEVVSKDGEVVEVALPSFDYDRRQLKCLVEYPHLKKLDLRKSRLEREDLHYIYRLENLSEIDLRETDLRLSALLELKEAMPEVFLICHQTMQLQSLEQLSQIGAEIEFHETSGVWRVLLPPNTTDQDLALVANLRTLRSLNIGGADISANGIEHLTRLTHLEDLNLSGTSVTDASIEALGQLKTLKSLWLLKVPITEGGAEQLKVALPDTRVEHLHRKQENP